jgi:hypothetical protein
MNLQLQKQTFNQGESPNYLTRGLPPSFGQKTRGNLPHFSILQGVIDSLPISASISGRTERISNSLSNAIRASRYILDLDDDWDEEGSQRFNETTWKRATNFITQVAVSFRKQPDGFWIDPPRILPGPKGSIDIHWKTLKRELLINVPDDDKCPADYYGSGGSADIIKGKLETSAKNEWILVWLTR